MSGPGFVDVFKAVAETRRTKANSLGERHGTPVPASVAGIFGGAPSPFSRPEYQPSADTAYIAQVLWALFGRPGSEARVGPVDRDVTGQAHKTAGVKMARGADVGLRGETAKKFDELSALFSDGRTVGDVLADGNDGLPPGTNEIILALLVSIQNNILAGDFAQVEREAAVFGRMVRQLAEMFSSDDGERAQRAPWSTLKREATVNVTRLANELRTTTDRVRRALENAERSGLIALSQDALGATLAVRMFEGRDDVKRAQEQRKKSAERVRKASKAPGKAAPIAPDIAAMKMGVSTEQARKLRPDVDEPSPATARQKAAAPATRKTHAIKDEDRTPVYRRTQKELAKVTRVVSRWDEKSRKWIDPITGKVLEDQPPAPTVQRVARRA